MIVRERLYPLVLLSVFALGCSSKGGAGTEGCEAEACVESCLAESGASGSCVDGQCRCEQAVVDAVDQVEEVGVGGDVDVADLGTDLGTNEVGVEPECTGENVLTKCEPGQGCVEGKCGQCRSAGDCASGYGCASGMCGPCTAAGQCAEGQGCRNGVCGGCVKATDCREGEACVSGECGACSTAQGCFGLVCLDGACSPCAGPEQCAAQYGSEYGCDGGVCVRESCQSDVDCAETGRLCDQQTFKCVECQTTGACIGSLAYGPGHQCLAGECTKGNCASSDDCPSDAPICGADKGCRGCMASAEGRHMECSARFGEGWICLPQGACVEGDCVATSECQTQGWLCPLSSAEQWPMYSCRPCEPLTDDERCRTEYGLDDLICEDGACVTGCVPLLGCTGGMVCGTDRRCHECNSTDECATAFSSGHICIEGLCVQGDCQTNADCAADGKVCNNNLCTACSTLDNPDGACAEAFGAGGAVWICESGLCIPGDCHTSIDCLGAKSGYICTNSACISCEALAASTEERDAACSLSYGNDHICAGAACIEGCTPGAVEPLPGRVCGADKRWRACATDAECAMGSGESSTICNFATGRCDAGCTAGTACSGGDVCGADHRCGGCDTNAECSAAYSSDFLCIDGTCQAAECNDEKACALGRVCDEFLYFCRDCESHPECGADKVCDLAAYGGTGRCRVGQCTKAVEEFVCSSGLCINYNCAACEPQQACGPTWQGQGRVCDGGVCVVGQCTVASQSDDCFSNLCVDHKCVGCTSLLGCGDGRVCDTGNQRCLSGNCIIRDHCGLYPTTKVGQVCDAIMRTCRQCAGASQSLADQDCLLGGYPAGTICVEGFCQQGCSGHSSCPSGLCVSGHCQTCSTDSQCGFNRSCNEDSGICVEGTCAVDADCPTPANQCRKSSCSLVGAAFSCTESNLPNGSPCNDGQFCTLTDTCQEGICTGNGNPCDDGLPCTQDNCSGAACGNHDINPGACKIGNTCYDEGTIDPLNPCQECRSNVSQVSWTADDTNVCTQFDSIPCKASKCQAGICTMVAGPNQIPCPDDGNPCTDDYCTAGTCVHPHLPNDTQCPSDGIDCTTDTCQNGVCINTPQDSFCNQPPDWTFEACIPQAGGCTDVGWARWFTPPNSVQNAEARIVGMATDAIGNIYLLGRYKYAVDLDPSEDEDIYFTNSQESMFIAKHSASGEYIWGSGFGGNYANMFPADIVASSDGTIFLIGRYDGLVDLDPGPGVVYSPANIYNSAFVMSISSSGALNWVQTVGSQNIPSSGDRHGIKQIRLHGDGLSIIGDFRGHVDLDPSSNILSCSAAVSGAYLLRLSLDGALAWAKCWDNALNTAVDADADGTIYVAGKLSSNYGTTSFDPQNTQSLLQCEPDCLYIALFDIMGGYISAIAWENDYATKYEVRDLVTTDSRIIYLTNRRTGDSIIARVTALTKFMDLAWEYSSTAGLNNGLEFRQLIVGLDNDLYLLGGEGSYQKLLRFEEDGGLLTGSLSYFTSGSGYDPGVSVGALGFDGAFHVGVSSHSGALDIDFTQATLSVESQQLNVVTKINVAPLVMSRNSD